jgi:hypothetical protein
MDRGAQDIVLCVEIYNNRQPEPPGQYLISRFNCGRFHDVEARQKVTDRAFPKKDRGCPLY